MPRPRLGPLGVAIVAIVAVHLALGIAALLMPGRANPPSHPVLVDPLPKPYAGRLTSTAKMADCRMVVSYPIRVAEPSP